MWNICVCYRAKQISIKNKAEETHANEQWQGRLTILTLIAICEERNKVRLSNLDKEDPVN